MPKPRSPNPKYVLLNTQDDEYRWHIRPKEWPDTQAIGWVDEPYEPDEPWDAVDYDTNTNQFKTAREAINWVIQCYEARATRQANS